MIFDIAMAYSVYGKAKGARVSSGVGFAELHEFEVTVLYDGDVPVVASWNDARPEHFCQETSKNMTDVEPFVGQDHVRFADGQFWRPLRAYELTENPRDASAMIDTQEFSRVMSRAIAKPLATWQNEKTRKNRKPQEHFESIERSDKDRAVREVARYLSKLAVVDDTVYVKCGRPFIALHEMLFSPEAGKEHAVRYRLDTYRPHTWRNHVARVITTDRSDHLHHLHNVFPIHDFKGAVKIANRINLNAMAQKDEIKAHNAIKAPKLNDYFRDHEPEAEECMIGLHRFVSKVENNRQKLLPVGDHDKLRVFCDLVSALQALPGEEGYELLETAGREYMNRYSNYELNTHSEDGILKRVLEIADNRPVNIATNHMPSYRP